LFTFSQPVAMPGVTLPAGEYLFRLANPESGRDVVHVLSADGRTPYGLFFSLPADRPQPAPTPEVRFMETAEDMPPAIRTWWYPGERRGYEFIYPKEQARLLAQGASQSVLTTQAQTTTTEQTNTADLARLEGTGQQTDLIAGAAPDEAAPTGVTQEGTIASANLSILDTTIPPLPASIGAPPVAVAAQDTGAVASARTLLPRTATTTWMVTVFGAVALVGGLGMWAWRRSRA
jgi:LPXTG-motif cell wall-anchored protein